MKIAELKTGPMGIFGMQKPAANTSQRFAMARGAALAVLAALMLAGCETTGMGVAPAAQADTPPAQPMTHTRAAELCWMSTEKGAASMDLDKRADAVSKCIDEKMKGAPAAPHS